MDHARRTGAIRASDRGVMVDILVVPNASRSEVVGPHGDRIKVRIASPPEKNKANAAVVELLARVVGVRRVEVMAGRTTRFKSIELVGANLEDVRLRLGAS